VCRPGRETCATSTLDGAHMVASCVQKTLAANITRKLCVRHALGNARVGVACRPSVMSYDEGQQCSWVAPLTDFVALARSPLEARRDDNWSSATAKENANKFRSWPGRHVDVIRARAVADGRGDQCLVVHPWSDRRHVGSVAIGLIKRVQAAPCSVRPFGPRGGSAHEASAASRT
jgi:hypothetical protein